MNTTTKMSHDKRDTRRELRGEVKPAASFRNSFERSLATLSKRARPGFISQRTHGTIEPNTGTIVNTRDKIRRNKRVRINGGPPVKFKRSEPYLDRLPIPYKVYA